MSFRLVPVTTRKPRIYTKTGDDGTTGLLFGGRIGKDSSVIHITGTVDEAQAAMGMARAEAEPGSALDELLTGLARELSVLMADALELRIDDLKDRFAMPTDFVVPGANRVSATLEVARTVVRRAERLVVASPVEGSQVGPYLNRLSDLLWAMARWTEGDHHLLARTRPRRSEREATGAVPDREDPDPDGDLDIGGSAGPDPQDDREEQGAD
jgi:cob(I)alamin adenosyltransferase